MRRKESFFFLISVDLPTFILTPAPHGEAFSPILGTSALNRNLFIYFLFEKSCYSEARRFGFNTPGSPRGPVTEKVRWGRRVGEGEKGGKEMPGGKGWREGLEGKGGVG